MISSSIITHGMVWCGGTVGFRYKRSSLQDMYPWFGKVRDSMLIPPWKNRIQTRYMNGEQPLNTDALEKTESRRIQHRSHGS